MELCYHKGWFKRGMEIVGKGFVPAYLHVLNSLKLRLLTKNCLREWREYTGLLVNATMTALFAFRRLEQNGNERAMLTTTYHGQRD
jgi:hypothetical protein